MALEKAKLVPVAFWVGFMALGFATSIGAPARRHGDHASTIARTQLDRPTGLVAQTEKMARARNLVQSLARD